MLPWYSVLILLLMTSLILILILSLISMSKISELRIRLAEKETQRSLTQRNLEQEQRLRRFSELQMETVKEESQKERSQLVNLLVSKSPLEFQHLQTATQTLPESSEQEPSEFDLMYQANLDAHGNLDPEVEEYLAANNYAFPTEA